MASLLDLKRSAGGESAAWLGKKTIERQSSAYDQWPLLHPRDIRLFQLDHNANLDAPLEGDLRVVRLLDAIISTEYDALSYTWEPPVISTHLPAGTVQIRDRTLTITGNLDRALRRIRAKGTAVLWVDMICINQANDDEKSRQVMLMYDIFSTASLVLAWLGEDPDLHVHYFIDNPDFTSVDSDVGPTLSQAFASRRYFHRRWVIQELVAGLRSTEHKVSFLCGSRTITWHTLKRRLASNPKLHTSNFLKAIAPLDLRKSFAPDNEGCAIIRQLRDAQRLHCQDARDRIYALSNLWHVTVAVDYSLTCAEVYIRFMLSLFEEGNRAESGRLALEIIAFAAHQQVSSLAEQRFASLASWMPDWRFDLPLNDWNSHRASGPGRRGYVEDFMGHHGLIMHMTVYAVVYDATTDSVTDVVTSDGEASQWSGLEHYPERALQEGDVLCRPNLISDYNDNQDGVSVILRPHPEYADVFSIVGRWQRSIFPDAQSGVPKKLMII